MADDSDAEEQIEIMVVSDNENNEHQETKDDGPDKKKLKMNWQETLANVLSNQQKQLKDMEDRINMADQSMAASSSSTSSGSSSAHAPTASMNTAFRLAEFDPDDTLHTVEEWLAIATQLKEELQIGDILMIAKAGEALKGRAYHYYRNWRPVSRTWSEFIQDLVIAFPDQETAGARAFLAATLRSRECESLSDYGITKLSHIKRFYKNLPWEITFSMVEYGLDHAEAQAAVRIQKPSNDRELLKLLSDFDARRRQKRALQSSNNYNVTTRTGSVSKQNTFRKINTPSIIIKGKGPCFKCGKLGHRAMECRTKIQNIEINNMVDKSISENTPPTCQHCKKLGHKEENCWSKNGKPKKIILIKRSRHLCELPVAHLIYNNKSSTFNHIIDSGAEISVINKTTAANLSVKIKPTNQILSGFGQHNINSLGTCEIVAVLANVSLEIEFTVVPDNAMPENLDAIIGWDVISRPNLLVRKGDNGLELYHNIKDSSNILSLSKTQQSITINAFNLDKELESQLKKLLENSYNTTPNSINTEKLNIKLKDHTPVSYRARRLSFSERYKLQEIIKQLLNDGIIRESRSEYASPIVLVQKKNGDLRLCVDYRDLNKKVFKEIYPLPLILDQVDALCDAEYFTVLDMKAGFHQIEISENCKHVTAFITPDGLYEYNRMPFGFVNSPAVYQRAIDRALGELKGRKAFVYMDDVLIPSKTKEEGFESLKKVIKALSSAGFKLNYEKCRFFAEEIEYLGVIIKKGSISPSPRKVLALTHAPVPINVKGVRQLLGLASYFRRFIKKFSQIMMPISSLLKKNESFLWSEACERARQIIIKKLTEEPILKIFNPNLNCELHTDASAIGIGAALLQKDNNAVFPIAYYSRRTTPAESKYHSYDLETLAIVDSVEHFRAYLYGKHFTIFTDCNAVRATAIKKSLHPRVARWWVKLQDYNFDIEYRPGAKMAHVDYLSRNPIEKIYLLQKNKTQLENKCQTIEEYQKMDSFCKEIIADHNKQTEYFVMDGIVKTTKDEKVYVPICARLHIMKLYHDESTHIGWTKCISKMREDVFFPKMGKCLKKYIRNCRGCVLGKSHTGRRSGWWQHGEKPQNILDTWHIDHAGPLQKSHGNTYILVIMDSFSKYSSLRPVKTRNSEDAIKALLQTFENMGKPKRIIADRGTAFTSVMFKNFLDDQNIELHLIATGMPRGNGQVERVMRTIFNLLRATLTVEKEKSWVKILVEVEDNINNTIHSTTKYTPSTLHFGTNTRLKATTAFLANIPNMDYVVNPEVTVSDTLKNIRAREKQNAKEFNISRYAAKLFSIGDLVAIEDSQLAGGGKLKAKFSGPYTVKTVLPNERYLLAKQGKRTTVAAHQQLRKWPSDQYTAIEK